jgi:integrase
MSRNKRVPWIGKEKTSDSYYIYWIDELSGRHKRRSCGTSDRSEAEKELGKFLLERVVEETNTTPILPPDKYLIATALRWYAQERGPELASGEFLGRAIESLLKFFGPKSVVSHVTPEVCRRYARERVRTRRSYVTKDGKRKFNDINTVPLSTGTSRRELGILSAAIGHAVKNGRLTSAPKVYLPKAPPNKTRYLTREEIELLLKNCVEPHVKLFVLLALNTGARKGALLELTWAQIDFTAKIINLNQEGRAQSNKRRAIVPINDALMQALNDQRAKLKDDADKLREKGEPAVLTPYVISYRNGPIEDVKVGFRMACERAGLTNVTPHTLRHTAGTLMALAGIDLFLIAKLLGHTVQKTTELYAHFHPEYLRGAVSVLSNVTPKARLYETEEIVLRESF